MSLEVAAKHLAAHGRHGDSTLVHMSPDEVAGLQALAQAKGKSLTINPRTGLPEAFNLMQELGNVTSGVAAPVLGAVLDYYFPGLGAATIGASIGATNYVATGGKDPVRSVMGGLGGYGGASVMGNITAGGEAVVGAESVEGLQAEAAQQGLTGAQADAYVQDQVAQRMANATPYDKLVAGASNWASNPTIAGLGGYKVLGAAALPGVMDAARPKAVPTAAQKPQMIRPYKFDYNAQNPNNPLTASYVPGQDTSERKWFAPTMVAQTPYQAADGGIIALAGGGMAAGGGPVEMMSNQAAMGANTNYPMANMATSAFATPYQAPHATNMLAPSGGGTVGQMSGEPNMQGTRMAAGGLSDLGGYSDGGRLLRGPGDGVSDSIPAQIGQHQPARLADGEFVVPARIVSELGNGSTEAGARQLYKMLDRVQQARGKTTGKNKVAKNTNAAKYLPA
jgi:hypothetical protein